MVVPKSLFNDLDGFIRAIEKLGIEYYVDSAPKGKHILYQIPDDYLIAYAVGIGDLELFFDYKKKFVGHGSGEVTTRFSPRLI